LLLELARIVSLLVFPRSSCLEETATALENVVEVIPIDLRRLLEREPVFHHRGIILRPLREETRQGNLSGVRLLLALHLHRFHLHLEVLLNHHLRLLCRWHHQQHHHQVLIVETGVLAGIGRKIQSQLLRLLRLLCVKFLRRR